MIDSWEGFHVVITVSHYDILYIHEKVKLFWYFSYYCVLTNRWRTSHFRYRWLDLVLLQGEEVIDAW